MEIKNPSVEPVIPERAHWNNKIEFVLACLSLSVGLGNVWRFPYLAYSNGGGAFLLPYILVLVLCGKPMYFMEVAFGQYNQEGPVTIWKKVSPIGRGVGVAQVIIQIMTAMYYIIIMAWTMYYFWTTLIAACQSRPVPWGAEFCSSEWAHKETCLELRGTTDLTSSDLPIVEFGDYSPEDGRRKESSAQQYFDRVVLMKYDKGGDRSYGLDNMGAVNWLLMASLAGCWVLMFFSLVKGISSAGKTVYITSTLPFIVLIILLGRGASLENASEGMKYFIVPQFSKLLQVDTWRNAAEQMFYSLSVSFGSLVMLGSYNQRNNNCYRDSMIVTVADTTTSITAGLAMFSILGYMAGQLNLPVETVAVSGPGLAFVAFPEAMSTLPGPHLWSMLFFVMLFTLGIGSEIATLETVLTAIYDQWPSLRLKKPLVCGIACFICFLLGFPFMTQGGVDLFDIFDSYAGGFSVLFPAFFEMVIVMWVYGTSRFMNNVKEMLGKAGDLGIYWRSTWGFLSPMTLFIILAASFIFYSPLNHGGTLPWFADGIGWSLAGLSIIQIPMFAIVAIYQAKGKNFKEKLHEAMWPAEIMAIDGSHQGNETYLTKIGHQNGGFDQSTVF